MADDLLMGIDVGTYETKGVLVTPQGKVVATEVKPHKVIFPRAGWAEHDPEGFAKAHPRPTAQELMQAAQNPERAARVVPPSGQPPQGNGGAQGAGAQGAAVDAANVLTSVVRNHMAMARSQGRDLSFTAALAEVSQFGGNGLQG